MKTARTIKRVTIMSFKALFVSASIAQCGMTANLDVQSACHEVSIALQTFGGNGPYAIVLEVQSIGTSEWQFAWGYPADADGQVVDQPYHGYWELTDQTRAVVTDADGCITVASSTHQTVHYRIVGYAGGAPVCGSNNTYIKLNAFEPANNSWTYSLDGASPASFNEGWTYPGDGDLWEALSNFTVSPGLHMVDLPGYLELQQGSTVEVCPEQVAFTAQPVIEQTDCGVNFQLRAVLAGALQDSGLMSDALRSANLIPTTEPYSTYGYTYTGTPSGMSMSPSLLTATGGNAIVDWVVVELRNTSFPFDVVHSLPALLQCDGDVISAHGAYYINAPLAPGQYRLSLRHRNHLGVLTGVRSFDLDPTISIIDLRSASTITFGTNARFVSGNVHCLWPGDANGDGTVRYAGEENDRDLVLQAIGGVVPTNTMTNLYDSRDINMDGVVRYTGNNNDRDIILQTIGGIVPTDTRVQQFP